MYPLDQYRSKIYDALSKNWSISINDNHTFMLRFKNETVKLEGTVGVSVTESNGHHTVRVAFYNYAGTRRDSIIIKDMTPEMVCGQIGNFIEAKEAEVEKDNDRSLQYRNELTELLKNLGFVRDCDSKYMSIFKSDCIMLTFNYGENMGFKVGISKNRKKIADKPIELDGSFTSIHWKTSLEGCINRAKRELGIKK